MTKDISNRMDLNLFRVFLAVYDAKSVGGAAHSLGMSQPGLSTNTVQIRNIGTGSCAR